MAALAAFGIAAACSSPTPTPQSGTNTNWAHECASDSECSTGSCKCGGCTRACSSASDCSSLAGAKCVGLSEMPDGCEVHESMCLLECTKDVDCSALGPHGVCGRNVCTVPACVGSSAPDCHAAGTAVCGADWTEALSLFRQCRTGNPNEPFLANCGPYQAVTTVGKDGYSAYFYDGSGKLVGRGSKSNIGVGCDAYDPSFVFPVEACTPIAVCGPDASIPPAEGGAPDGGADGSKRDGGPSVTGNLATVTATDVGTVVLGEKDGHLVALESLDSQTWTTWTAVELPGEGGALSDVAFGNGTLVALGPSPRIAQIQVRPPSGSWQYQPVGANIDRILFASGTFLASAGVEPGARVSSDGVNWTIVPNPSDGACCVVGAVDGKFVAFGSWPIGDAGVPKKAFRTSTDGLAWSAPMEPVAPIASMSALEPAGDLVVGLGMSMCRNPFPIGDGGDGGTCVPPPGPMALQSSAAGAPLSDLLWAPPAAWTSAPEAERAVHLAANATRIVAVAPKRIYSAPVFFDSQSWETRMNDVNFSWSDVAYSHGRFVAVGSHFGAPVIVTSVDGRSWQVVYGPQ